VKQKDEGKIVLVGAACEVCGRWRVRSHGEEAPVPTDECIHCGADHKALREQRSVWNSKHRYGSYERPGQLIEAVCDARARYDESRA
jgi:Zn ribbon nucleic-acid-binding protein